MYTATANPDIAHTVGNATFIMLEYLRSQFPENFFKYTHVGTRIAYKEFINEEDRLRPKLIKKVRPILSVRPRPIFFDDDIFMAHTPLTYPIFSTPNNPDYGEYTRVFRDNEKDITLGYKMNRMRVQFLVSLFFDTEIQQQNIYMQLRNRYKQDRPYWLKTSMEITVPYGVMETISKIADVPLIDPETGTSRKFLEYMMQRSNRYFTYKQNHGKDQNDYFLYYPLTMECVFSDFSLEDPSRRGQIIDYAAINFTFTTEFNTIGIYQLSTEKDDVDMWANSAIQIDGGVGTTIVPMYTVDKIFRIEDKDGYKLFFTNIFGIDEDTPHDEPDILDLKSVFKDSALKEIIGYHKKHGLPFDILFRFIIMKNNHKLNGGEDKDRKLDYVVDLENERILLYNKTKNATYRLLCYVNNLHIMTLTNSINDLENRYEDESQQTLTTERAAVKNEAQEGQKANESDPNSLEKGH